MKIENRVSEELVCIGIVEAALPGDDKTFLREFGKVPLHLLRRAQFQIRLQVVGREFPEGHVR